METTVQVRLTEAIRKFHDHVAISDSGRQLSYQELGAKIDSVAARISAAGIPACSRIALIIEDRMTAVSAILGVICAGHTYIPLDINDPDERLKFILQDSMPALLISDAEQAGRAREFAGSALPVIDLSDSLPVAEITKSPPSAAEDLLYIFYTSGSTGQPKGVRQTHQNLLFFVDAYVKTLRIEAADRLSMLYTLSFSAANMDIFGALLNGATLCLYDMRRQGVPSLASWLKREEITVLHTVPTVFRDFGRHLKPEHYFDCIRAVDLGGETLFAKDVEGFRRHVRLDCLFVNHLAATEASVIAQHVIQSRDQEQILPVGLSPDGVSVSVIAEDGSQVKPGETGRIVVSSQYLSPGYWQRPDLDAQAFSANPNDPVVRHFIAGDMGFIDREGRLHFLGREGSRVKIRGYSVEINEVEVALRNCPNVKDAVVLAPPANDHGEAHKLIAYLSIEQDASLTPLQIRQFLRKYLPHYMLPTYFVFLVALPQTATGKLDRQLLVSMQPGSLAHNSVFEAPGDEIQKKVATIYEELLSYAPVGINDDFFLLGGDSLLVVELQLALRSSFGMDVPDIYQDATVAGVANKLTQLLAKNDATSLKMSLLIPLRAEGNKTPLFLMHGRTGQALVSRQFLDLLGRDQPVYAFQARGLDGLTPPHDSIQEMVDDYLRVLRDHQPQGPYFLGGLCVGCYITTQMARQLTAEGEQVLPLLLLDPPPNTQSPRAEIYREMFKTNEEGRLEPDRQHQWHALVKNEVLTIHKAGVAQKKLDDRLDHPHYAEIAAEVAIHIQRAFVDFRPKAYAGPVILIASGKRLKYWMGNEMKYLKSFADGAVKWFRAGNDHEDTLNPGNPYFVRAITRAVEIVQEAATEYEYAREAKRPTLH